MEDKEQDLLFEREKHLLHSLFVSLQLPDAILEQHFLPTGNIRALFEDKGTYSILQSSLHQPLEEGDYSRHRLYYRVYEERV